jgi:hypothetical protein
VKKTYVCAMCGKRYKYVNTDEWNDEKAMKETKSLFGSDIAREDCDVVCDDCYRRVCPARN